MKIKINNLVTIDVELSKREEALLLAMFAVSATNMAGSVSDMFLGVYQEIKKAGL
jgi:hypothetical protein